MLSFTDTRTAVVAMTLAAVYARLGVSETTHTLAVAYLTDKRATVTAIPRPQALVDDGAVTEILAQEEIGQYFGYAHLKPEMGAVSAPFGRLAAHMIATLPRNPERTVALRKLLESKDCAVRAFIAKPRPGRVD